MENNNLDYNDEWGILIHQLPEAFMGKAIRVLPRGIKRTFIDRSGMRVYFYRKEICDEFIYRKFLDLDGIIFNIFSTVTCLTIFGIAPVASKETIETYLKAKDLRVLDLYQIVETNHYRIILDVPEVFANIELNPILLDASYGSGFPMEFYCRVCRREGHKQYQCQQISTENHGEDDKRKRCAEAYSNIKRNSNQGSFVKPSSSDVRNTRSRSEGIQKLPNVSSRQNADLTVATPSTSDTLTAIENLMRRNSNLTQRKKEDFRNTRSRSEGIQKLPNVSSRQNADLTVATPSTSDTLTPIENLMRRNRNLTPRKKEDVRNSRSSSEGIQKLSNLFSRHNADLTSATPSTSGTLTAVENLMRRNHNLTPRKKEGVLGREILLRSPKNTTRISKNKYSSRGMIKSIRDTKVIQLRKHLLEYVKLACKMAIKVMILKDLYNP